jgi:hypothetical protein
MYLYVKCSVKQGTWNKKFNVINQQKKWHMSCVVLGKGLLPWHPWLLWLCFHPYTHQTLKNHKKHLNKHFHYFLRIYLLGSIDFEIDVLI